MQHMMHILPFFTYLHPIKIYIEPIQAKSYFIFSILNKKKPPEKGGFVFLTARY
jgi:hypothetical protein